MHAAVQDPGKPPVRLATAANQQRPSREGKGGRTRAQHKGDASSGVARRLPHLHHEVAQADGLAVEHLRSAFETEPPSVASESPGKAETLIHLICWQNRTKELPVAKHATC